MFGHLDVVKLLLRHGVDPSVKNHEGLAAYEFSLGYNFPHITEYLKSSIATQQSSSPSPVSVKVSSMNGTSSNGSSSHAATPSPSISTSSSVVMPATTVFSVTIPTNTATATPSKKVTKLQTAV